MKEDSIFAEKKEEIMVKNTSDITNITTGGSAGRTDLKQYTSNLIDISGCLVLMVDSGYAIVSIGLQRRVLRRGMVALLFYDDTLWVERCSQTFACRYVSLSYDNVEDAIYKLTSPYFWDFISEMHLFHPNRSQWKLLENWFSQMEWICTQASEVYRNAMLQNNIYNLFMAMDGEIEREGGIVQENKSHARSLMIQFLKLITQHCKQTRSVTFYADKLCITTTYLNKLSHQWWNLSPKELINQQTICEIKNYLATTDRSVKEIASMMQFEDTSYLCRYFRKLTGISPVEYRNGRESKAR